MRGYATKFIGLRRRRSTYWKITWLTNMGGVHHGLDHRMVSQLLRRARYIIPVSSEPRPYYHVCLTGRAGHVYETYVYLVPELDARPARCVIVTCYQSNKQIYR